MDNLEKFIAQNRANFDVEIPDEKVWSGIEKSLLGHDDLEGFISQNRTEFDAETPHLKLWANIEKQLILTENNVKTVNLKAKTFRLPWLRQLAAAIALLVIGASLGIYFAQKNGSQRAETEAQNVAPDFKETEDFYNQKVENQLTKLASYNPDPSVISDLKQLDDVQRELKAELTHAPESTREEIVRRMIQNYQIKLGILERVLNHIEENKNGNQNLKKKDENI